MHCKPRPEPSLGRIHWDPAAPSNTTPSGRAVLLYTWIRVTRKSVLNSGHTLNPEMTSLSLTQWSPAWPRGRAGSLASRPRRAEASGSPGFLLLPGPRPDARRTSACPRGRCVLGWSAGFAAGEAGARGCGARSPSSPRRPPPLASGPPVPSTCRPTALRPRRPGRPRLRRKRRRPGGIGGRTSAGGRARVTLAFGDRGAVARGPPPVLARAACARASPGVRPLRRADRQPELPSAGRCVRSSARGQRTGLARSPHCLGLRKAGPAASRVLRSDS